MWKLVLLGVLTATPVEFDVQTLQDEPVRGALVELTPEHVIVQTADGPRTLASDTLVAITSAAQGEPSREPPALSVRLRDGSELKATRYSVHDQVATISLPDHLPVDVPKRAVRSVRFRAPGADETKLDKQWTEITQSKAAGDVLVARKDDDLDSLEGVHGDVDEQTVHFELDQEPIVVKRNKVEGLLYYHAREEQPARAMCRLFDVNGNSLAIESASVADDEIKITTPAKLEIALPLSRVVRLDYSQGKIVYLSDLEPERVKYTPPFGAAADLPAITAYYAPRRDTGFEQQPLRLGDQTFRKGLALRSRTSVVYRLPDRFGRFLARVGIDPNTSQTGSARLAIKSGGRTLWQGDVRGGEPAQELDVKLNDADRLELVVDYGESLDVGDDLNLANARVTK